jgi:hypothetical protein
MAEPKDPTRRGYDVDMIRDFHDQLVLELKGQLADMAKLGEADEGLEDEVRPYVERYRCRLCPHFRFDADVPAEDMARFRAIMTRATARWIRQLEGLLSGTIRRALRGAGATGEWAEDDDTPDAIPVSRVTAAAARRMIEACDRANAGDDD